ncbi:2'-5' RNA ligase family protein [Salinarimonas ramus]|nr:2'-5' RNA ligase family protein [Salinarimonas ramus]
MDPLILTLALDEASFARFDGERHAHFPRERNLIPAHVTLFHKLPGEEETAIAAVLTEVAGGRGPLLLACTGVRFLGRGVAYVLEGGGYGALRGELALRFAPWLGAQDKQAIRPHVTIQNKVTPQRARDLAARLEARFEPFPVSGEGLLLWRYRGGPWEPAGRFDFNGGAA